MESTQSETPPKGPLVNAPRRLGTVHQWTRRMAVEATTCASGVGDAKEEKKATQRDPHRKTSMALPGTHVSRAFMATEFVAKRVMSQDPIPIPTSEGTSLNPPIPPRQYRYSRTKVRGRK